MISPFHGLPPVPPLTSPLPTPASPPQLLILISVRCWLHYCVPDRAHAQRLGYRTSAVVDSVVSTLGLIATLMFPLEDIARQTTPSSNPLIVQVEPTSHERVTIAPALTLFARLLTRLCSLHASRPPSLFTFLFRPHVHACSPPPPRLSIVLSSTPRPTQWAARHGSRSSSSSPLSSPSQTAQCACTSHPTSLGHVAYATSLGHVAPHPLTTLPPPPLHVTGTCLSPAEACSHCVCPSFSSNSSPSGGWWGCS